MKIDTTTEFGARVERRLREEQVGWLTTVRADGQPLPSPIWFVWDGATLLIYSQPNTPKVRNIAANPRVSFNLNSTADGEDIVTISGEARIVDDAPLANEEPTYFEKYQQHMPPGMTPEAMAKEYSVAIRVTPTKLRGF